MAANVEESNGVWYILKRGFMYGNRAYYMHRTSSTNIEYTRLQSSHPPLVTSSGQTCI